MFFTRYWQYRKKYFLLGFNVTYFKPLKVFTVSYDCWSVHFFISIRLPVDCALGNQESHIHNLNNVDSMTFLLDYILATRSSNNNHSVGNWQKKSFFFAEWNIFLEDSITNANATKHFQFFHIHFSFAQQIILQCINLTMYNCPKLFLSRGCVIFVHVLIIIFHCNQLISSCSCVFHVKLNSFQSVEPHINVHLVENTPFYRT